MPDRRPFCYLWIFDPDSGEVHVANRRADHPADFPTHKHLAETKKVSHPERVDGWAIAIKEGWRIFTSDFSEADPYIKERVKKALAGKHPPPALPSVRYHGLT